MPGSPDHVEIEVIVPTMLRDCTEGQGRLTLAAPTLGGALDTLMGTHPLLRLHVYQEDGSLRPHVLIYLNDENIAWLDQPDRPLRRGDRLAILQNVSGG